MGSHFSSLFRTILVGVLFSFIAGCGYTQRVVLPYNIRTIAVTTFENKIPPQDQYTYRQGLEIELTNAIRDRLIFDGNLKVVEEAQADAVLKGAVISYKQEAVRFDDLESVEEYRLFLVVKFELVDQKTGKKLISEPNFSGRTEFFAQRNTPSNRGTSSNDTVQDLARNIVDRIVEEW